ncbi:unnamed protein product [Ixodes pacificus]
MRSNHIHCNPAFLFVHKRIYKVVQNTIPPHNFFFFFKLCLAGRRSGVQQQTKGCILPTRTAM